jgi:hypothetical protein
MRMRFGVAMTALVAMTLSGCALMTQAHVDKMDGHVTKLESFEPDLKSLAKGDLEPTYNTIRMMSQVASIIDQDQETPPEARKRFVARVKAASRRYQLKAALLAKPADSGYWLAFGLLSEDDDAEVLAEVRQLADARIAERQRRFAHERSYELPRTEEVMWETTSSGMSVVNGQVVEQHESKSAVEVPGNCVFATAPFGPEGTPNPKLTFRATGAQPRLHVRCYLVHRPEDLPAAEGRLIVTVPDLRSSYQVVLPRPHGWPRERHYVDFVLEGNDSGSPVPYDTAFFHLGVRVEYEYFEDNVVIWEDGAQRVRKQYARVKLAESGLFYDRDGTPPGGR